MPGLREGAIVRWRDRPDAGGTLGIVLAPVSEETVYVLTSGEEGLALEVFAARVPQTGVAASELALEQMEVIAESELLERALELAQIAPHWWRISAHWDGAHDREADPECPLCEGAGSG